MIDLAELLKGVNLGGVAELRPPNPFLGGPDGPPPLEGEHFHRRGFPCPYCGVELDGATFAKFGAIFEEIKPQLQQIVDLLGQLHPKEKACLFEGLRNYGEPTIRKMLGQIP